MKTKTPLKKKKDKARKSPKSPQQSLNDEKI